MSVPIQYAAVQAFKGGTEIEEYLCHARKILSRIGNECAEKLNIAGIRTHTPVGGFYLFLDFSNFNCKQDLFTSRIAYVDFDGAIVLATAKTIPIHEPLPATFTITYCNKVLECIDKLINWFNLLYIKHFIPNLYLIIKPCRVGNEKYHIVSANFRKEYDSLPLLPANLSKFEIIIKKMESCRT